MSQVRPALLGAGSCWEVSPALDTSARFRQVVGHVPTGVAIITAMSPGGPLGMAVNSFTSVSLSPPLVLFCAAKTSATWPGIRKTGAFAVNILSHHDVELCRRFAQKNVDRFAGSSYRLGMTGAPILDGSLAHLDCYLYEMHEAGDHVIVLGRVSHVDAAEGIAPLIFHRGRYRSLPAMEPSGSVRPGRFHPTRDQF